MVLYGIQRNQTVDQEGGFKVRRVEAEEALVYVGFVQPGLDRPCAGMTSSFPIKIKHHLSCKD